MEPSAGSTTDHLNHPTRALESGHRISPDGSTADGSGRPDAGSREEEDRKSHHTGNSKARDRTNIRRDSIRGSPNKAIPNSSPILDPIPSPNLPNPNLPIPDLSNPNRDRSRLRGSCCPTLRCETPCESHYQRGILLRRGIRCHHETRR